MQRLHVEVSIAHANTSLNILAAPLEWLFWGLSFILNEPEVFQGTLSAQPPNSHPDPPGEVSKTCLDRGFQSGSRAVPGLPPVAPQASPGSCSLQGCRARQESWQQRSGSMVRGGNPAPKAGAGS